MDRGGLLVPRTRHEYPASPTHTTAYSGGHKAVQNKATGHVLFSITIVSGTRRPMLSEAMGAQGVYG